MSDNFCRNEATCVWSNYSGTQDTCSGHTNEQNKEAAEQLHKLNEDCNVTHESELGM